MEADKLWFKIKVTFLTSTPSGSEGPGLVHWKILAWPAPLGPDHFVKLDVKLDEIIFVRRIFSEILILKKGVNFKNEFKGWEFNL